MAVLKRNLLFLVVLHVVFAVPAAAEFNDKGCLAYAVRNAERLTQIMLHDGENVRAVVQSQSLSGLRFQTPALNNQNQIAITTSRGIFLVDASGGEVTTERVVSAGPLGEFDGVTLTDAGHVTFRAKRPQLGIYQTRGGQLRKLVDTSGAFASLGPPSCNNGGQIALHAIMNEGTEAIVASTGKTLTRVIATGDPLGDSTVTALRFCSDGLNDQGQVAFWALLLDGSEAIYRATPVSAE